MIIKMIKKENEVELQLEGRLDSNTAISAQESFLNIAKEYPNIELNFKKLEYISSAGLRTLLMLQKTVNKTNGRVYLTNVGPSVLEVLEITGFSTILDIK